MLCILWDIDGTLMSSQGAGTKAMNDAFQVCFGIPNAFEDVAMSGCTDPWIFRQGYERHGIKEPFPSALEKFDREYRKALPGRLATSKITLKPGLPALLETLSKRDDVGAGLLTGNFEHGAETKLRAAGIWHYFATGAYGSDDEDRNKLLPHALRRFKDRGRHYHAHRTIVIGDTTRDVACARAHGAKAVAVATGGHRMEELRACSPDLALQSLADPAPFLGFLEKLMGEAARV
jgi:phosphoglycolate phosphatase